MAGEIQQQTERKLETTVGRDFFRMHGPKLPPQDKLEEWLLGALNDPDAYVCEFNKGNMLRPATGKILAMGTSIGFITTMVGELYLTFVLTWHRNDEPDRNHRAFAVPHPIGWRIMYLILKHLNLPELEEAELIKSAFGGKLPEKAITDGSQRLVLGHTKSPDNRR